MLSIELYLSFIYYFLICRNNQRNIYFLVFSGPECKIKDSIQTYKNYQNQKASLLKTHKNSSSFTK